MKYVEQKRANVCYKFNLNFIRCIHVNIIQTCNIIFMKILLKKRKKGNHQVSVFFVVYLRARCELLIIAFVHLCSICSSKRNITSNAIFLRLKWKRRLKLLLSVKKKKSTRGNLTINRYEELNDRLAWKSTKNNNRVTWGIIEPTCPDSFEQRCTFRWWKSK